MTDSVNSKLMDTEPGGENTQYESQNTVTQPPSKSTGQFSDSNTTEATQQAQKEKKERGEKTAENIRYGEAISEHGFGGETVGNSGGFEAGGGGQEGKGEGEKNAEMRKKQGYSGEGSGVGA